MRAADAICLILTVLFAIGWLRSTFAPKEKRGSVDGDGRLVWTPETERIRDWSPERLPPIVDAFAGARPSFAEVAHHVADRMLAYADQFRASGAALLVAAEGVDSSRLHTDTLCVFGAASDLVAHGTFGAAATAERMTFSDHVVAHLISRLNDRAVGTGTAFAARYTEIQPSYANALVQFGNYKRGAWAISQGLGLQDPLIRTAVGMAAGNASGILYLDLLDLWEALNKAAREASP